MPLKLNENYLLEYVPYHRNKKEKLLKTNYFNSCLKLTAITGIYLVFQIIRLLFINDPSRVCHIIRSVSSVFLAHIFFSQIFGILQIIYKKRDSTFICDILACPLVIMLEVLLQPFECYMSVKFIETDADLIEWCLKYLLVYLFMAWGLKLALSYGQEVIFLDGKLEEYENYLNTKPKRPKDDGKRKPIKMEKILKEKRKKYCWYKRFYFRKNL